ncbi:rod shape-determining protein MreD [Paenibacillus hamazuiensis]|uniref:rod shape-determining protein MreD n=1 Tax=Paenibacillus hamazuiensis TaxID=2936508 RepID=UPI00200CCE03|nr:rod shape-determining protein MreD [Paenibacillus hamazuiensis]
MTRNLLWLSMLGLFVLEGSILQWLMPAVWQSKVHVAPHFILIVVLYIGLYKNRHTALFYGLGFGLLQDMIYYSPMLGPISFSMGLAGYLAGLAHRRTHNSIVFSMIVISVGLLLYEMLVFGLYTLFRVTHLELQWVFFHQMLPSMLINLLFALAIYVPVRKFFENAQSMAEQETD